ncbi:hypothetical protein [Haloparvum sp. AD34]
MPTDSRRLEHAHPADREPSTGNCGQAVHDAAAQALVHAVPHALVDGHAGQRGHGGHGSGDHEAAASDPVTTTVYAFAWQDDHGADAFRGNK